MVVAPVPDAMASLQGLLTQLLQGQQALAQGQQEQAARLAALETAPKVEHPKAEKPKKEDKSKAKDGAPPPKLDPPKTESDLIEP